MINIGYFMVKDQVDKVNIKICYCPQDDMKGDNMKIWLSIEKISRSMT